MSRRPIELTRAAYGLFLLLAPRQALASVHRIEVDRRSLAVARILGGRQLAQAGLSGLDPSPEILAMGVWVDLAHGATALGLAAADRPRASAGLSNAFVSLIWAGWGRADLGRGRVTAPEHDRLRDILSRHVLALLPCGPELLRTAGQRRSVASQKRRSTSAHVSHGIGSVS